MSFLKTLFGNHKREPAAESATVSATLTPAPSQLNPVRPSGTGSAGSTQSSQKSISGAIQDKLSKAGPGSLRGTTDIKAVAILYENPRDIAMPPDFQLANLLVEQYKATGYIPHNLSVQRYTPVAARQLIYGQEISMYAGLDAANSNRLLAEMLANLGNPADAAGASAIAFRGESDALGQTFFAVLAK